MTEASNVRPLRKVGGKRVPRDRVVEWEAIDRWRRTAFHGATPGRVKNTLRKAEKGDVEDWADLAEYMLRTDPHLRSVYETFLRGVASAELLFQPGVGDPTLAEAAAAFARESWEMIHRWDRTLMHLLHAVGVGPTVSEQHWDRRFGAWHVVGHTIVPPRDTGYTRDWGLKVRTFAEQGSGFTRERWIDLDDEPARWLIHMPGSVGLTPNVSGLLQSVAWHWLFKLWGLKNGNIAVERLGIPFMYGVVGPNASPTARNTLFDAMDAMAAGHAGVVEEGSEIKIVGESASGNAGKAHKDWITLFDDQITKGILGSTLNVDAPSHHGNRALGDSQATITIMPRFFQLAASAAHAIRATWLTPILSLNRHVFGGRVPPIPKVKLQLVADEAPVVDQLIVDAGAVRVDELRRSRGLLEWGPDAGGDRIVKPVAKAPLKTEPKTSSQLSLTLE